MALRRATRDEGSEEKASEKCPLEKSKKSQESDHEDFWDPSFHCESRRYSLLQPDSHDCTMRAWRLRFIIVMRH